MMLTPSGRPLNVSATGSLNFSRLMPMLIVAVSPALMVVDDGPFNVSFLPPSPSVVFVSRVQPVPYTSRLAAMRAVETNE
jgi:hypothetical protein